MDDSPLTRPEYLRPALASRWAWFVRRPAGVTAAVLGLTAFIVIAIVQPTLWSTPDWRLSVSGLVATAIAVLVSVARREQAAYPLWLTGLALAGAALVLGWFLMLAIVIGAAVVLILILHAVM
ncbi:MAG TPA: hypothetical protein VFT22_11050 [Kofleriaceae bacterium]|nr:hypothetical protein [Kofleriaceae bacterium]